MNRMTALFVLAFFASAAPLCAAETWADLNKKLTQEYQAGKHAEALKTAQKALAAAKTEYGTRKPEYSIALNNVAMLYKKTGKFDQAEQFYNQSLALAEELVGPESPDITVALNNLAMLYEEQGEYPKADAAYKRIVKILEKAYGPNHPNVQAALKQHAAVARKAGADSQAAKLEKQAAAKAS